MRPAAMLTILLASVLAVPLAASDEGASCAALPARAPDATGAAAGPLPTALANLTNVSARSIHVRVAVDDPAAPDVVRLRLSYVQEDANYSVRSTNDAERLKAAYPHDAFCVRWDAYVGDGWDFRFTEARVRVDAPTTLALEIQAWAD